MAQSLQHVTGVSHTSTSVMHLKEELVAQMCHCFTNIKGNPLLAVSTLLDPRLKRLAFRDSAAEQGAQWLIQEMVSFTSHVDDETTKMQASE